MPHIAVPFGHGCGGGRFWCRLSSGEPLPRCVRMPQRRSRMSAVPGRAGSRCPAGRLRCPRVRTADIRRLRRPGPLDQRRPASATCAALPWCRNGGLWVHRSPAAAGRAAGHRGRCLGGCGTGRRRRRGCPLLPPDGGGCPDGWRPPRTLPQPSGCPLLQEAVVRSASAGRCRYCRYASPAWWASRSRSCSRT
jgi:hypothetical protein